MNIGRWLSKLTRSVPPGLDRADGPFRYLVVVRTKACAAWLPLVADQLTSEGHTVLILDARLAFETALERDGRTVAHVGDLSKKRKIKIAPVSQEEAGWTPGVKKTLRRALSRRFAGSRFNADRFVRNALPDISKQERRLIVADWKAGRKENPLAAMKEAFFAHAYREKKTAALAAGERSHFDTEAIDAIVSRIAPASPSLIEQRVHASGATVIVCPKPDEAALWVAPSLGQARARMVSMTVGNIQKRSDIEQACVWATTGTIAEAAVAVGVPPRRIRRLDEWAGLGETDDSHAVAPLAPAVAHNERARAGAYALMVFNEMCVPWFDYVAASLAADGHALTVFDFSDPARGGAVSRPGFRIVRARELLSVPPLPAMQVSENDLVAHLARHTRPDGVDRAALLRDAMPDVDDGERREIEDVWAVLAASGDEARGLRNALQGYVIAGALRDRRAELAERLRHAGVDAAITRYRSRWTWPVEAAIREAGIPQIAFPDAVTRTDLLRSRVADSAAARKRWDEARRTPAATALISAAYHGALPTDLKALLRQVMAGALPSDPWSSIPHDAQVWAKDSWIARYAVEVGVAPERIRRVPHPALDAAARHDTPHVLINAPADIFASLERRHPMTPDFETCLGFLGEVAALFAGRAPVVVSPHPRLREHAARLDMLDAVGAVSAAPGSALLENARLLVSYMGSSMNIEAIDKGIPVLAYPLYEIDGTLPEQTLEGSAQLLTISHTRDELLETARRHAATASPSHDAPRASSNDGGAFPAAEPLEKA